VAKRRYETGGQRNKMCWRELDSAGSGDSPAVGSCEHGNEPSSSIRVAEFRNQVSDYQFLNKNFTV
jgi:hypothetical protein